MKSWQEQVSELKDLLEKQQLNSKKKWPATSRHRCILIAENYMNAMAVKNQEKKAYKQRCQMQTNGQLVMGQETSTPQESYRFWRPVCILHHWYWLISWRQ